MLQFINATEKDIPEIQRISNITWPVTFKNLIPDDEIAFMVETIYNTESLKKQMQNENFLLVYKNNEAIGYGAYELNYKTPACFMIHKAYVLPKHQGIGVGKQLFAYFEGIAKENNQKKLRLQVFQKNENSLQFYLKQNFKNVGIDEKNLGDGHVTKDFVMEKEL